MRWKIRNKKASKRGILPSILSSRGLSSEADIESFLNPRLSDLHDPFLIPDMQEGVTRVLEAAKGKQKVAIYGDYDADGVTATSLLWKFLYRELRLDVIPYIPSRFDEGYGLNEEAIEALIKKGVELIITVDCGIKDTELIEKYSNRVEFIVTDHHTLPDEQDFDHIAIHPAREDSKYPYKNLAGAVVAWKLVCALCEKSKKSETGKAGDLDPYKYIDLASIGTVADVMPLTGENRVIVKYGLKEIRKGENVGLQALMKVAGRDISKTDTYDIGFVIGPRINAAGRMKDAITAVKLFSTENPDAASKLAHYLNNLNLQRREETEVMMQTALTQVSETDNFLFAYDENWNEGIVGLVAGKLKEKYYKPSIVATKTTEGTIVGSARSIQGINITNAIAMQEKLLVRYGGHSQAAGLSFEEQNTENIKQNISKYIADNFETETFQRILEIDLELELSDVTMELFHELEKMAPFGEGNPRPVFAFRGLEVVKIFYFGQENRHLKIVVTDSSRKKFLYALGFRKAEQYSEIGVGDKVDLAGKIDLNEWNNQQSLQFIIDDIELIDK
ncbi:single-stranded-DNA-specific exonuclease RecJ [Candidatus Dojkabacteria bacterium]|nr:single-stranded-DNA-specific exonuclease RecJ [Candidatus Dojkabacteria bacterium]